jgi:hypothetical protein
MAVPLDPLGNVVLSLQIVILFLLILGLPFVKGRDSKKNVMRHGYLTALALVLHTVLIFIIMIPSFNTNFGSINQLSVLESIDVWSHIILGTLAEVSGIVLVGLWMFKSPSKMTCARRKRWMMPIFIIWTISIINGALIHLIGII